MENKIEVGFMKNEYILLFYDEYNEKESYMFFNTLEEAKKYVDNCIKECLIWYENFYGILKTKYYNDNIKKLDNIDFI